MLVGILDHDVDDIAGLPRRRDVAQIDVAVDLRRVGLAAAGGADAVVLIRLPDLVDEDGQGAAALPGEFSGADRGGLFQDVRGPLFHARLGPRWGPGVPR